MCSIPMNRAEDKNSIDLNNVKNEVIPLLDECSEYLRKKFSSSLEVSFKDDSQFSTSVVTEADKYVEKLLFNQLLEKFPSVGFIGEENTKSIKDEYNWVVDPVDGTGNFATGIPLFAISIALLKKNAPVAAFISFPFLNETIVCIKGSGVFLNNKKVLKPKKQSEKLVGLYSHVGSNEEKIDVINKIINYIGLPKYYSCTVYSGVAVALGKANCIICINNALWDIAGIWLLIEEMGYTAKFLSDKPNINRSEDLTEYKFSAIFGEENVVNKLYQLIRS